MTAPSLPKLDLTTATDDEKFAWCCKVLYEEQGMTDSGKLAAGFLLGWVVGLRDRVSKLEGLLKDARDCCVDDCCRLYCTVAKRIDASLELK